MLLQLEKLVIVDSRHKLNLLINYTSLKVNKG